MPSAEASNRPSAASPDAGVSVVRPDPVPLELDVLVTGARPAEGENKRGVFTEATSTVLILENGAVIRLTAAVAVGQLLFLNNTQNSREVVAQVIRKRSFRPTSCYVELEFTEAVPRFWGMDFPAPQAEALRHPSRAAEIVESAEIIADSSDMYVIAPNELDVERLREELDSARQKIQDTRQENIAEEAYPVPPVPAAPVEARSPVALDSEPVAERGAEDSHAVSFGLSAAEVDPGSAQRDLANLNREVVLPKRARRARARSEHNTAGDPGKLKLRIGLLVGVVLVAGAVGAWQMNLFSGLTGSNPSGNKVSTDKAQKDVSSANPESASPPASTVAEQPAASAADPSAPLSAGESSKASRKEGSGDAGAVRPAASGVKDSGSARPDPTAGSGSPFEPSPSRASAAARKSADSPRDDAAPIPPAGDSSSTSIVYPKLLKAANVVYPPDAMRQYITGDVTLDAVVDSAGVVRSMKVISGPQPLRAAAKEALQQYKYAPATQDGKPVAAHVKVTIKFWFNP